MRGPLMGLKTSSKAMRDSIMHYRLMPDRNKIIYACHKGSVMTR